MDGFGVTLLGAFGAGLLSFASPCVLPLVPGYLGFLGGTSLQQLTGERRDPAATRQVFIAALAFVAGFVALFVALGATASALSAVLIAHFDLLAKIAGVVIVLFGLHFIGIVRIPLLYREARLHLRRRPAGVVGAFLVGVAFAFGWTPCVGPVLAGILTVAASTESVGKGMGLLGAYGLGIGVPFLAAAAATGPFLRLAARLRSRLRAIEMVLGALLVITGIVIFAGSMPAIGQWLLDSFPILGRIG